MQIIPITEIEDERVAPYRNVRDADLRGRDELFMAEGRFVVSLLLRDARYQAESVLVTEHALEAIRPALERHADPPPVYLASREVMGSIVGFDIHRGCLSAGRRLPVPDASDYLAGLGPEHRLLVLAEDLVNHDNMGGVFRSAAAFGASAVLITPRCCDPLYRKAIRVSMGHALRVPYATIPAGSEGAELLRRAGFLAVALTTAPDAVSPGELARKLGEHSDPRVCLLLGSEGEGLTDGASGSAAVRVRIPIAGGVDSLNATVAASIAMQRVSEHLGLVR